MSADRPGDAFSRRPAEAQHSLAESGQPSSGAAASAGAVAMDFRSRVGARKWSFKSKVVTVCCAAVLLFVLWRASGVLMLVFGAVLIATLLSGFARSIKALTGVPVAVALAASIATPVLLIGGAGVLFGPRIWSQIRQVADQAPAAVNAAGAQLGISNAYQQLTETVSDASSGQFVSQVAGYGFSVVGGATDLVLVLAAGIYLAADPRDYRDGVVKFFPTARQARIRETMSAMAASLRRWFLGQLVSMLLVGTLSGLAYWWIGLPTPAGLAVIAGVTNFVPIVGPLISAVPALLLAFLQSPTATLWTAAAILAVQQVDGNIVMPIVQNRAVNLPPAIALLSILLSGAVFGVLGVILAAPLAVACMVAVQKLWFDAERGDSNAG